MKRKTKGLRKQTKVWVTKDGRRIRICDMTDEHLVNTIKMLERATEIKENCQIAQGYAMLGFVNGDMAQLAVDQDLRALEEDGLDPAEEFPIYEALTLEAMRRGVDWNAESKFEQLLQGVLHYKS